ncbi:MAG TPA: hypothetical protein P5040_04615, partial [Smithella sp.]|nr:hypothetical protein [Smithella sp.]
MNTPASTAKKSTADKFAYLFLKFFAFNFNTRPSLNRYLRCDDGWLNFTFGFRTENGSVEKALRFENGRVSVLEEMPEKLDAQLIFIDEDALKEAATQPPNRLMLALMENRMITRGNLGYLQLINFYLSLLLKPLQIAKLKKETRAEKRNYDAKAASRRSIETRKTKQLRAESVDGGVRFLNDPYLSDFSLDDFPRLKT